MRGEDFIPDIDYLKKQLVIMSTHVSSALEKSFQALFEHELLLAHSIISDDRIINSYELDIDSGVFKYLSMNQPEEADLRLLLAMQKIVISLERIGDHAVNIAESALNIGVQSTSVVFLDLPHMADLTQKMFLEAMQSFHDENGEHASEILTRDEAVDILNANMSRIVKSLVMGGEMSFDLAMELIRVSKNLERIADLSTNIAEEAIFTLEARIVKHHAAEAIPVASEATQTI
jgi:phosphate transport system protein